jgi:hypothetical protein
MGQIFEILIRFLGQGSDHHRATSTAHLSDARHLGDSQAFLIVLRTSSRDGANVSTAPAVDRKHRLRLLQKRRDGYDEKIVFSICLAKHLAMKTCGGVEI